MDQKLLELSQLPVVHKGSNKSVVDILFNKIYPLALNIQRKMQKYEGDLKEYGVSKLEDVFSLCISQIKKCFVNLFDVFQTEYHGHLFLQESRQCIVERLSWCVNKLYAIEEKLDNPGNTEQSLDDSIFVTPMYFVNWIDHTIETLLRLSQVIYRTDWKDDNQLYEQWKNDVVDCVSTLHLSLDELLLTAMTLCKYCLPADQRVVKARCQVVLRESKSLLHELIDGDLDTGFKVTTESLKLPIMPSNVNVLIDVLKDVLYVLETNTNTALLALVVHCFSNSMSPVDVLKNHFLKLNATCSCDKKTDEMEDCPFVKEFDLYNERLLQIGSFAVSCSSDQGRILTLRSGLATLEALDPVMVPALLMSPRGHHACLLAHTWKQEVLDIRDSIFLIVDPAAFAEKSQQIMHQQLLQVIKEGRYGSGVHDVINIGAVVKDFFAVYNQFEPDALTHHEKLVPLLELLNKGLTECKVVSNLLATEQDFVYEVKMSENKQKVTFEQLLKRLKLLYTVLKRINILLQPKEDDELFDEGEEESPTNETYTLRKNSNTQLKSPKKAINASRSMFARTANIRSSTNKFPLQKLAKHLRCKELSFSLKLDEINLSGEIDPKPHYDSARSCSILYNFSKKRSSLRKAVLNRCKMPLDRQNDGEDVENCGEKDSIMDEATSLQITDILNEMTSMTAAFSKMRIRSNAKFEDASKNSASPNVLRIPVNCSDVSKRVWNIPVNGNFDLNDDSAVNSTGASNASAPSNVTTMERITDIEFLNNKLNSLKSFELEETSL